MGEYLGIGDKQIMIGTCENMYYARITDLQNWPDRAEVREYLDPDRGYRYRFPFPE